VNSELLGARLEAHDGLRKTVVPGQGRIMPSLTALDWFHHPPATNVADAYAAARLGLSHDVNLLEGVPKANGFFSLYVSRQQDVEHRVYRDEEHLRPAIADVMAIEQTTAPGALFDWISRSNYLAMISVGQEPRFVSETNTLDALLDNSFDPHATVLLPAQARASVVATRQPAGKAVLQKFGAHQIEINVDAPGTALVTISQTYYPPWKAYVDGQATPIWRANHAFQAVQVAPGHHVLQLRYEDRLFRLGAAISIGVALAMLACLAVFPAARAAFYSSPANVPK
jgi:hypothetical protein